MNAVMKRVKDFIGLEPPQQPSILARLQRGVVCTAMNKLIGFSVPFTRRNKFQVVEMRTGYLKAKIPLKPNQNHLGTMYAGAMFLLAEVPGGIIALVEFSGDYFPVLKEFNIRYLLPAQSDLTVEVFLTQEQLNHIRQQAEETGKSDFTLNLDIRDVNHVVVAQAVGIYQLRRKK